MKLKIGELAKRSGLTVRALHHYDKIGLLCPTVRADNTYRLYDDKDVLRLYRIQALRRLQLSLEEIRLILDDGSVSMDDIVRQQISLMEKQASEALSLRDHLLSLSRHLTGQQLPVVDDWLTALEMTVNSEKYFTSTELEALRRQRKAVDTADKSALIHALRDLMQKQVSPENAPAQSLSLRWLQLMRDESGGDEAILIKFYQMQSEETALQLFSGLDQATLDYMVRALACASLPLYEAYCDSEELEVLRQHSVTDAAAWPALIAALHLECVAGSRVTHPRVQELAKSWQALSLKKAGNNARLQKKIQQAFAEQPELRMGIDNRLFAYLQSALKTLAL
ncbi:MerR family transcriptional regulator [Undibacterium pigrum]|uniref:DNA-binding transcriptional MerR regulator n=1 Tax=Undibacterium pigrum TaxID=401470 RepID=A0A318J5P7_9BURK|nr:MerR family transcriptional regulator [Undibacterium pigrum]PXX41677.1 DNA-binding transcriptional MerR regulator [Undibacterium pigrum]